MNVGRYAWGLAALALVSVLTLAFQNCAEGLPDNVTSDSNGPTGSGGRPFAKGDVFDYTKVPNASQMVTVMLTAKNYASQTAPKAVAATAAGLGFVSVGGATQEDANLSALQGCFAISGGQNCALLAIGDKFSIGKNDLGNAGSYVFSMTAPAVITSAAIPFVTSAQASALAAQYTGSTQGSRALAVALDGTAVYVANGMTDVNGAAIAVPSATEASRIALERCEMMATITPCTSFAEGATIKFNPSAFNRTALIDYNKTAPSGWFPGQTTANGTTNINNRWNPGIAQGSKGVVYISADGHWGEDLDTNLTVADTTAKNQCNTGTLNPKYPCFKYADSTLSPSVLFRGNSLTAYANSLNLHCRAVPRYNCVQHKNMGCPGGSYYVTYTGAVSLENCPP